MTHTHFPPIPSHSILQLLLIIAVVMRFVEEIKSSRLSNTMIHDVIAHAHVLRDGVFTQINMQVCHTHMSFHVRHPVFTTTSTPCTARSQLCTVIELLLVPMIHLGCVFGWLVQTVVPGDIVKLGTGQLVPGDCRLLTSRDLSVT